MTDCTKVRFVFHSDGLPVDKLFLKGSWDNSGAFSAEWANSGTELKSGPDGFTAELELRPEPGQTFFWGVKNEADHWMLFENEAIQFVPSEEPYQSYRLGHREWLGVHRIGIDGVRGAVWAPNAKEVDLEVRNRQATKFKLTRSGEYWEFHSQHGWNDCLGSPYRFRILTSDDQIVFRSDPYAKVRQGPQRGVSDLFLSSKGEYCHRYSLEETGHHLLRFECARVANKTLSEPPRLKLRDISGQLTKEQLRSRFTVSQSLPTSETWWTDHVQPDGAIRMVKNEDCEAYSICLGPETGARGLFYEIVDEHGTSYHDRWSNYLDGHHNWARYGVISETRRASGKSTSVPREAMTLYELHVGSILGRGGNLRPSTFLELSAVLPKIKELGFNSICLMPTNATEGNRDWGYLGTSSMAHQEAFSEPGMDAEQSLIRFIELAHDLDLRVFTDVVYNHVGGFHNDLWEFDGLENPWFERASSPKIETAELHQRPYDTAEAKPRVSEPTDRGTPWGTIPAYNKKAVFQFFVDHAVDQVERLGFDGIRFDFTHLIHAAGSGDREGWTLLQAIHHRLEHFFPQAVTFAEEFPPHPAMTDAVEQGGAGFHGMWNTEHQHRLIFDHHRPSITQCLVEGCRPDLQSFLEHLTFPKGFSTPCTSATVLSNHDEVGNAKRLFNLVEKHPRGLDIARLVSWFSLLCPGYPILFQGTEDLASNFFSWGLPHTWDLDSHLASEEIADYRKQHLESIKDVLNLRLCNTELWANHAIDEHYIHDAKQILAIRRGSFWIVGNFSQTTQVLPDILLRDCKLCLSSEKQAYGYSGKQTRGKRVGGFSVKIWRRT